MPWILAFHLFGIIFWLGGVLLVTRMLGLVPEEVGVAKEQFILAARRLFGGINIAAMITLATGILLVLVEPSVLRQAWLHIKLLLVLILLIIHARIYRRIVALESEPGSATRREFAVIHGITSALLLAILILALLKPF